MAMEIARISTKFQFCYSPYLLEGPQILLQEKVIGLTRWGSVKYSLRIAASRIYGSLIFA